MERQIIDTATEEGRAALAAYEEAIADEIGIPQQLFARIKKSSKYYGQGERGSMFPVYAAPDAGGYHLIGGPGGRYRLADVNLYIVAYGAVLRLL